MELPLGTRITELIHSTLSVFIPNHPPLAKHRIHYTLSVVIVSHRRFTIFGESVTQMTHDVNVTRVGVVQTQRHEHVILHVTLKLEAVDRRCRQPGRGHEGGDDGDGGVLDDVRMGQLEVVQALDDIDDVRSAGSNLPCVKMEV